MNENTDIKKTGVDKLVLMGLFIASLLIAHFIVATRSTLEFSELIELPYTGLSVSMPLGNGWQTQEQWQYQENTYFLSSDFNIGSEAPTVWADCRYLLATESMAVEMWFEQRAAAVDGKIIEIDQQKNGVLTIDWAHIEKPELLLCIFIGTTVLPNNRRLNIEVHQIASEFDLAEKVFKEIVQRLNLEDDQLLNAGTELVEKIKAEGLSSFLEGQQQVSFLIGDFRKRIVGFTIDILNNTNPNARFNIQAETYLYFRGQYIQEQTTLFQGKDNIDEFVWQSETSSELGRSSIEIFLDEDGTITITQPGAQIKKRFRLGPAAIPEIFFELLLKQMLESDQKKVVVDILNAQGKITPTLISIVQDRENASVGEDAPYVIGLEFLDGRGFSEQVYLDERKQISRAVLRENQQYILERADTKQILEEFPEHARRIMQINRFQR